MAALERIDMSRKRIRRASRPSPGLSTRISRSVNAFRSFASAPGRLSPSRTKSPLGSKMTTGSRVCMRICSRATPSANVLPDPLCPHQKVCRLSRFGTTPPRRRARRPSNPAPGQPRSRDSNRKGPADRCERPSPCGTAGSTSPPASPAASTRSPPRRRSPGPASRSARDSAHPSRRRSSRSLRPRTRRLRRGPAGTSDRRAMRHRPSSWLSCAGSFRRADSVVEPPDARCAT